jgi:hypothetical protein
MAAEAWQHSSLDLFRFQIASHQAEREVEEEVAVAN